MATCRKTSMALDWNRASKPATCKFATFPTFSECEVLNGTKKTLSECLQCLIQQKSLASEYHVLRRLVYMKHGQLRREKSFQGLKQIRGCLKKFFDLGLEKTVKEMNGHFQDALVQEGIRGYLPSQQMWEHLLTQFLSAAANLTSTASRCCAVFLHVYRHLAAGMLIPANTVFLAMLSRIWACCQGLCLELHRWYQLLKPVTDLLKPTEVAWLPEGEALPANLSAWLTEQGYSSSVNDRKEESSDDDTVASLMAKYQVQEQEEVEEGDDKGAVLLADSTLPVLEQEDLGVPVDTRKMKRWNRQEDISVPEDSAPTLPVQGGKVGMKEKIKRASTLHDLQLILQMFQKKCQAISTNKQSQKCSEFLASLQSKSQALEGKEKEAQAQVLLTKGRKKLRQFLMSLSSRSENTSAPVYPSEQHLGAKKRKKKNKAGKNMTQNQPPSTSANVQQDGLKVKKRKKNHAVSEIKSKKKRQKDNKTATKDAERKRQLQVFSANKKDSFESRKRKKNDPAQVKQKKKKARKV